ncbi:ChaN family lipoprotein [Ectothiorhodospira shaposhnikovii]|uniref:ChaN family lipoprotein n=1 Tax=Ectothiorhodospira shaposhnikovii TaxID=1054 RepID=UPI0039A04005
MIHRLANPIILILIWLLCAHPLSGAEIDYFDTVTGARISESELMNRLRDADTVLIGELHGNVQHHRVQARIIQMLVDAGAEPDLYFEMLSERQEKRYEIYRNMVKQPVAFLTLEDHDRAREEALEWSARGWHRWDAYAPLFEMADRAELAVLHADLPDPLMRNVSLYGSMAIPRSLRDQLFPLGRVGELESISQCLLPLMRNSHQLDEGSSAIGGLVIAQLARDAYMALRLSQGRGQRVLVAGREHVRTDVGVPRHLKGLDPKLRILTIAPMEANTKIPEHDCADDAMQVPYDILWESFHSPP